MSEDYFYQAIHYLRTQEEAVLHDALPPISVEEENRVVDFLQNEFQREALQFPEPKFEFDADTALWSAKVIYTTMQLVLNRKDEADDLENLYPVWKSPTTAHEMVTADLCLRFIPDAIFQLESIDPNDPLISYLQKRMNVWCFSLLRKLIPTSEIDFTLILDHPGLFQMSVDRIIKYKNLEMAKDPLFISAVRGSLGMHINHFWKELNYTYESN